MDLAAESRINLLHYCVRLAFFVSALGSASIAQNKNGQIQIDLGARYQVRRRRQLFVQINNLLGHHYYTATQLGPTGFTDSGSFIARPLPAVNGDFPIVSATFYAPGAPLGVWGGLRLKL
jgi:hypothetical protein